MWQRERDLIAKLDPDVPLQLAHIRALEHLIAGNMRYSNEDCDVRGRAYAAIGRTEIRPWEAGWVRSMTEATT